MVKVVELVETKPHRAMVIAKSVPDQPGIAAKLFTHLGAEGLNIEMISESGVSGGKVDVSFAVQESQADKAVKVLEGLSDPKIEDFTIATGKGILTVYGKELATQPGIAGRIFSALAKEGVNIDMISTSFSSISVLIKDSYLTPSKNLVIREFKLDA